MYREHAYSLSPTSQQLKVASLNVCGLRSKVKYGILEKYVQDFDIICLMETKTEIVERQWFVGYDALVMPKKCDWHVHGGIHGICILVKNTIAGTVKVIDETCSSSILWIYVKSVPYDMVLGAVYMPCENSKYYSNDSFQNPLSDLALIEGKFKVPIILIGDFNARSGTMSDIIAEDNAVDSDHSVSLSNIFDSLEYLRLLDIDISRHNQDTVRNKNGHQLIECCKTADIKIVNGRLGSDAKKGSFTCVNANGKSVIDYVITSSNLLPYIGDFKVQPLDKCLSDAHCSIEVILNSKSNHSTEKANDEVGSTIGETCRVTYKWNSEHLQDFMMAISPTEIDLIIEKMESFANTKPEAPPPPRGHRFS